MIIGLQHILTKTWTSNRVTRLREITKIKIMIISNSSYLSVQQMKTIMIKSPQWKKDNKKWQQKTPKIRLKSCLNIVNSTQDVVSTNTQQAMPKIILLCSSIFQINQRSYLSIQECLKNLNKYRLEASIINLINLVNFLKILTSTSKISRQLAREMRTII